MARQTRRRGEAELCAVEAKEEPGVFLGLEFNVFVLVFDLGVTETIVQF